jgi:DNA-directed RNA polymerase specialized sigma24 family protein
VTPGDRDPLHGWTLAGIHSAACMAVTMAGPKACDVQDRFGAAWSAIAEAILTADDPPSAWDLRWAGVKAIQLMDREERRQHGLNRANDDAEGFWMYWFPGSVPSPEAGVIDRLASAQIWDELRPVHQSALLALAAHDDRESAAAACGKHPATFNSHLSGARRAFLALWHEGEKPSRFWGKDDRRHDSSQPVTLTLRKRAAKRLRTAEAAA